MRNKKIYLKSVESFLVGKRMHRKQFLKQLESDIDEFLHTFPNASVKDLQTEFGTRAEMWNKTTQDLHQKDAWDKQIVSTLDKSYH